MLFYCLKVAGDYWKYSEVPRKIVIDYVFSNCRCEYEEIWEMDEDIGQWHSFV